MPPMFFIQKAMKQMHKPLIKQTIKQINKQTVSWSMDRLIDIIRQNRKLCIYFALYTQFLISSWFGLDVRCIGSFICPLTIYCKPFFPNFRRSQIVIHLIAIIDLRSNSSFNFNLTNKHRKSSIYYCSSGYVPSFHRIQLSFSFVYLSFIALFVLIQFLFFQHSSLLIISSVFS